MREKLLTWRHTVVKNKKNSKSQEIQQKKVNTGQA